MRDELETLDEDQDNPFDLMAALGWHTSDQDDGSDDDEDPDDWDEDVYSASQWLFESSLGDWGQFADGVAADGSSDSGFAHRPDQLSSFDHARLVLYSRSAARKSQAS